jgi:hypothetical protein
LIGKMIGRNPEKIHTRMLDRHVRSGNAAVAILAAAKTARSDGGPFSKT